MDKCENRSVGGWLGDAGLVSLILELARRPITAKTRGPSQIGLMGPRVEAARGPRAERRLHKGQLDERAVITEQLPLPQNTALSPPLSVKKIRPVKASVNACIDGDLVSQRMVFARSWPLARSGGGAIGEAVKLSRSSEMQTRWGKRPDRLAPICSLSYCSYWCRLQESNPRPTDYKSVALPTELNRPTHRTHALSIPRMGL